MRRPRTYPVVFGRFGTSIEEQFPLIRLRDSTLNFGSERPISPSDELAGDVLRPNLGSAVSLDE